LTAVLRFHELVNGLGNSRETSLAKTKSEEAVMWAVMHITAQPRSPAPRRRRAERIRRCMPVLGVSSPNDLPAALDRVAAFFVSRWHDAAGQT
jgi:hypothetical protein